MFVYVVDGIFNGWMEWSECSVTCGNGTRDRHRTCFGPFDDGANCTGDYDQRAICVTELCAGMFSLAHLLYYIL